MPLGRRVPLPQPLMTSVPNSATGIPPSCILDPPSYKAGPLGLQIQLSFCGPPPPTPPQHTHIHTGIHSIATPGKEGAGQRLDRPEAKAPWICKQWRE